MASLPHSTNANSYSESIDFKHEIVLWWMTILGVEISVKLHTLEPRSAQSRAFLSGVKGKVPPGTSVRRSIFQSGNQTVNCAKSNKVEQNSYEVVSHLGVGVGHINTARTNILAHRST